jgi:predicted dehydrogenase
MDTVKVGVIGVGRMGQRHCRILSNLRHAELAGIADPDAHVGRQLAVQYGIPYYPDAAGLLDRVQAVVVATPTPAHFATVLQCLERRVHVLVEKPMAESVEQAAQMAAAAEASGVVVQVGHIERFNPAYIELKNVLEHLTPLALNLRRLSPSAGSNTDVDVVLDLLIHDANLILDLMGQEPTWVSGYGLTAFSGTIDYATAHLAFKAGPIVNVTASRVTEQKVRSIEVTAREGYLECDLLNRSIMVHRSTIGEFRNHLGQGFKYRQESLVERIHVPNFESLFLEVQHFVECVLEGRRPAVSARDGLQALALALRVRDVVLARMVEARQFRPGLSFVAPVEPVLLSA